jgi:hypothetical protein
LHYNKSIHSQTPPVAPLLPKPSYLIQVPVCPPLDKFWDCKKKEGVVQAHARSRGRKMQLLWWVWGVLQSENRLLRVEASWLARWRVLSTCRSSAC